MDCTTEQVNSVIITAHIPTWKKDLHLFHPGRVIRIFTNSPPNDYKTIKPHKVSSTQIFFIRYINIGLTKNTQSKMKVLQKTKNRILHTF